MGVDTYECEKCGSNMHSDSFYKYFNDGIWIHLECINCGSCYCEKCFLKTIEFFKLIKYNDPDCDIKYDDDDDDEKQINIIRCPCCLEKKILNDLLVMYNKRRKHKKTLDDMMKEEILKLYNKKPDKTLEVLIKEKIKHNDLLTDTNKGASRQ
jgi:hypothetical protein